MHEVLEKELAEWVEKPAALVFSTGMQTNLGAISALVGRGDVVVLDKEDHASIVDGARLSYGKLERYRHNDMDHLERVLQSIPDEVGKLIVVDGLFSMEATWRPCRRFCRLPVDTAPVSWWMMPTAWGCWAAAGDGSPLWGGNEVDLIMSTFSKSFASLGGFVAGDADVISYIKHHARALIFSASIPPANAAAALAALRVMRSEPERVARVNQIAEHMRNEFRRLASTLATQ